MRTLLTTKPRSLLVQNLTRAKTRGWTDEAIRITSALRDFDKYGRADLGQVEYIANDGAYRVEETKPVVNVSRVAPRTPVERDMTYARQAAADEEQARAAESIGMFLRAFTIDTSALFTALLAMPARLGEGMSIENAMVISYVERDWTTFTTRREMETLASQPANRIMFNALLRMPMNLTTLEGN